MVHETREALGMRQTPIKLPQRVDLRRGSYVAA